MRAPTRTFAVFLRPDASVRRFPAVQPHHAASLHSQKSIGADAPQRSTSNRQLLNTTNTTRGEVDFKYSSFVFLPLPTPAEHHAESGSDHLR